MFGPLMHAVKCLQAESVIYDHCTGTVKKKNRSMSTAAISNVWNSLPDHVVDVNSLKQFETRLDKFWSNKDVMFDWTGKITGTGDRSEFNYKLFQKVLFKVVTEDTVIEALVPTTVSLLC